MNIQYILVNGEPVLEPDTITWARWFEVTENRRLARDVVGDYEVSTVFLGIDHRFAGDGPPILWETMVFSPVSQRHHELECERYCTREEALIGHALTVERLKRDRGLT